MKTKIACITILLACGFLTVAASADQSFKFSLSDVSKIGTAELKPGEYKVVVDAPKVVLTDLKSGICSINRGGQVGVHEEPRTIVSARCLIRSAREGICLAPLTRSRMY